MSAKQILARWGGVTTALLLLGVVRAEVRGSINYSVSNETLDGGGRTAASPTYRAGGSVGVGAGQPATSDTYLLMGGFLLAVELAGPPPPTAAGLACFRADWRSDGSVEVVWQTLVEVQVVGFEVQRSVPGGGWERVGLGLIPAQGQTRPHLYTLVEEKPAVIGSRYRLIEIDLRGDKRVAGETGISRGLELSIGLSSLGLSLKVVGEPSTSAAVEVAEAIVGPWTAVSLLDLDEAGVGACAVELDPTPGSRFYRVIER